MIKLYSTFINDINEADYILQYNLLSDYQREKIDSKANCDDKRRSIAALVLLRRAVSELYGKTDYTVEYTKNGKPTLPFCHISLSHSGNMAVCAVSDSPIGVDVQQIHPVSKNRFFTSLEAAAATTSQSYTEIWTKKEAAVKMLGGRLADCAAVDTFSCNFNFEISRIDDYIVTICTQKM